ncbi:uncharacterized protein [Haliotis cracherodii]|uniref:uncharacterized protein n=1 Tax=Haliotis cracherodii TaxID=6455 RepID=UPI0039E89CDC
MLPLIYGFFPNRTEATYTSVFDYLKQTAETRGLQLSPDVFQLDFERASYTAAGVVFPNAQLRGCFFHYTQSIWRCTQKLGLGTDYKSDDSVKKLVRRAAALPLVPLDKVEDVWIDAIAEAQQDDWATQLMDYVTTSWIEGAWNLPTWNHFEND